MLKNCGIVCGIVAIGFIVTNCDALRHSVEYSRDKSIECYECNSAYDPRCGDPFDPYTIGKVNCSKKRPLNHINFKPTLCRKTVQKVQGHIRVIRGCGYIPDDRDDKQCFLRSGTHDVQVKYCSCKHDLCNAGNRISINNFFRRSIVLITVFALLRLSV